MGSKLNGERIPAVRGPKQKLRREGSKGNDPGREVEVVKAPGDSRALLFSARQPPGILRLLVRHYEIYVYTSAMVGV